MVLINDGAALCALRRTKKSARQHVVQPERELRTSQRATFVVSQFVRARLTQPLCGTKAAVFRNAVSACGVTSY
ncbi:MAG: hypothetical protein DMF75_14385 [Acidobacteria bacterium]|nr:MAG: hypothetical protein DMF75_14385 [Acidobacteriota bacterium]